MMTQLELLPSDAPAPKQPARSADRPGRKVSAAATGSGATVGYEAQLWQITDALRGSMDAAEYKNVVLAWSFADRLKQTLRPYQNRTIEAAQVIEQLIKLAKDLRELEERGMALDLSENELAFYDPLGTNDSAVKVLGDETLRNIARDLMAAVRSNVTIDWTLREDVRARLRVIVKRILRKHGYPPDKQEKATQTVLEQAEVLSEEWAATQLECVSNNNLLVAE